MALECCGRYRLEHPFDPRQADRNHLPVRQLSVARLSTALIAA